MSKFVNYHKREFTLPPGCKNLIDVLRPRPLAALGKGGSVIFGRPSVTRGGHAIGRLSEVPRYVSMLVASRRELFVLMISTIDERLSVMLYRDESEGISALVLVSNDTERERGIREFFAQHKIELLQDYLIGSGAPPARNMIYQLPASAPDVSRILTDLLRRVYACTDESDLQFRHYEPSTAA